MSETDRRGPAAPPQLRSIRANAWARHPAAIHLVAVAAAAWGAAYLTWRIGWSGRGTPIALFVALLVAELFGWVSLSFYMFLAWHVPATERPPITKTPPTVDVFVCTYDESEEVLEATLTGCSTIRVPHTTYLLDDGRRADIRALAQRMGVEYVTRPDNSHAKAGNINHALRVTSGELILFLDADHVPLPDVLDATVGYFEDHDVALVQSPHDFSNRDSVQHTRAERHEQTLFYEVIAPGKDLHNAMFWCGSATLIRRVALEEVGGVFTDTVAEDFHTTIAMHARGWRTRYHNEVLVQGLAPHDLAAFLLQRARWARGNLAVFRTKQNPLTCRGLTPVQRTSYFASLFNYFSGAQRALLLVVLICTLALGRLPMHATVLALAALWLPWTLLAFASTNALGRGTLGAFDSTRYGIMTIGVNLRGIVALFTPRAGKFVVTPKEGVDEGGLPVLRMLGTVSVLAVALAVTWLLRVLAWAGAISLPDMPLGATIVCVVLGVWEMVCIGITIVPLVRRRQIRRQYRNPVALRARVASSATVVRLLDISTTGVGIIAAQRIEPGSHLELLTRLPGADRELHDVTLQVEVRSCFEIGGGRYRVGGLLDVRHAAERAVLYEYCHIVLPAQRLPDRQALPELPEVTAEVVSIARAS